MSLYQSRRTKKGNDKQRYFDYPIISLTRVSTDETIRLRGATIISSAEMTTFVPL
jgi:hypothetical protein